MWVDNPKGKAEKEGLTHDQKLLIQLVLMGKITGLEELAKLLGKRKNNLMSRDVTPLLEMGLLERDGRDSLKVPGRFEQTLHEVFVHSGGEERWEQAKHRFRTKREEYGAELDRIQKQVGEISKKGGLDFMDIDFDGMEVGFGRVNG